MDFPDRLRVAMSLYRLRPQDVIERSGLSKPFVLGILTGKYGCSPRSRRRLLEAIYRDDLAPDRIASTRAGATPE